MGKQLTIAPELEEGGETGGTLVTHTEGTTALAAIKRQIDIVLEQTRHTVVGEPLAQFDHGYEPGRDRQILGDMAQSPDLFLVGLLAIGGS